jgi:cell division protein FtsI/penicillin-binding protein 2
VTPRLIDAWNDGNGWKPVPGPPPASVVPMSPSTSATVRAGLWHVVNRAGTGRRGRVRGRDVIGKTGTAQVISLDGLAKMGGTHPHLRDHGWFVFAAPRDAPRIAGAVFAEHAEHGYLAAPIARHVMETFFAKAEGQPLPVLPPPAPPAAVPAATPEVPAEEPAVPLTIEEGAAVTADDGGVGNP